MQILGIHHGFDGSGQVRSKFGRAWNHWLGFDLRLAGPGQLYMPISTSVRIMLMPGSTDIRHDAVQTWWLGIGQSWLWLWPRIWGEFGGMCAPSFFLGLLQALSAGCAQYRHSPSEHSGGAYNTRIVPCGLRLTHICRQLRAVDSHP